MEMDLLKDGDNARWVLGKINGLTPFHALITHSPRGAIKDIQNTNHQTESASKNDELARRLVERRKDLSGIISSQFFKPLAEARLDNSNFEKPVNPTKESVDITFSPLPGEYQRARVQFRGVGNIWKNNERFGRIWSGIGLGRFVSGGILQAGFSKTEGFYRGRKGGREGDASKRARR
ncbi:hypothetical protein ACLOJK_005769 [Asimina triloba]